MKNTIIIILCIFKLSSANAQNPGYFNRKNVIEFSANGQTPIFANFGKWIDGKSFQVVNGDNLEEKMDHFDYGFRLAFMHTFKRDLGAGIEFGYDYFSIQRSDFYSNDWTDNFTSRFEKTDVSSMMIMPKIEFSNKGSVLPMGISHQIGLGVRFLKPVDKKYHYVNVDNYTIPGYTNELFEIKEAYQGNTLRGMTFMYAVNVRTPLSKRLFLNYGVRYTMNFMAKSNQPGWYPVDENSTEIPAISEDEFRDLARQRKQLSVIQANIGLSFAF